MGNSAQTPSESKTAQIESSSKKSEDFLRRKKAQIDSSNEIVAENFYQIFVEKRADDDFLFHQEFQKLPNFDDLPATSGNRPTVLSKNRFFNIVPIDDSRVQLKIINDDLDSDYINGNFISGYRSPKKFIATQAPKKKTCHDFWRMICELNIKSIVMLTNLAEGNPSLKKCHRYWPEENETIDHGFCRIKFVSEECFIDYDKRFFQLIQIHNEDESSSLSSSSSDGSPNERAEAQENTRLVTQFHFKKWKDMDVPERSDTLIDLIFKMNEEWRLDNERAPIVVHCTAGVGRTGTFIGIDAMIERLQRENQINIFDFIAQMRRERHAMVQTLEQYIFIHRCVLEFHLFGRTAIEAEVFPQFYEILLKNNGLSLTLEFHKLSLLSFDSFGFRDENQRFFLPGIDGNFLLSGSWIEGFSLGSSLIITEDPQSETIERFWRFFLESNTNGIVQLHTLSESPVYFLDKIDISMAIGNFSVLKLLEKKIIEEKIVFRRFFLLDRRQKVSKLIEHFEFLHPISNNDKSVPIIDPEILIDSIQLINQLGNSADRLLTIHSESGGSCCGIFAMTLLLIDQLEQESVVDIFQSVRHLQRQRPSMINSLAQYKYLYRLMDFYCRNRKSCSSKRSIQC